MVFFEVSCLLLLGRHRRYIPRRVELDIRRQLAVFTVRARGAVAASARLAERDTVGVARRAAAGVLEDGDRRSATAAAAVTARAAGPTITASSTRALTAESAAARATVAARTAGFAYAACAAVSAVACLDDVVLNEDVRGSDKQDAEGAASAVTAIAATAAFTAFTAAATAATAGEHDRTAATAATATAGTGIASRPRRASGRHIGTILDRAEPRPALTGSTFGRRISDVTGKPVGAVLSDESPFTATAAKRTATRIAVFPIDDGLALSS
jgi:hypothetical protein